MTVLYLPAAALAVAAGMRAVLGLWRGRSAVAAGSALCMLLSGTALALTAAVPSLLQVPPPCPPSAWAAGTAGLAAAWALAWVLASVAGAEPRPAPYLAVPAAGAVVSLLALAAPAACRHGIQSAGATAASSAVLLACYFPALSKATLLAWRCSRGIPLRHVCLGMRAVAAGAAVELALLLDRAAETVLAACGAPACPAGDTAAGVAQGAAAIAVIVGATAAAWFPALASAARRARMWLAWWRLRPLWAMLLAAVPDVRLPVQPGTRLSAAYRLHRVVVELRDAQLALRPYRDAGAARGAERAARAAGLPPGERDAVVEAVMIVTAVNARRAGAAPAGGPPAGPAEAPDDLESEAGRLLQVSRAVRRSPIVSQAARREAGLGPG